MASSISSDQRFWIEWDIAVAVEILENRDVLPTPEAIQAVLLEDGDDPTVTLELVKIGMAELIDALSHPSRSMNEAQRQRRQTFLSQLLNGPNVRC